MATATTDKTFADPPRNTVEKKKKWKRKKLAIGKILALQANPKN